MRAGRHDSPEAEAQTLAEARMQAISISANLKYELQKGAIIENTPAPLPPLAGGLNVYRAGWPSPR